MKKSTLVALVALLNGETIAEPDTIKAEVEAELNRGADEKAAKAAAYEKIHSPIVDNLSSTPVTCADLFAEIEAEVTAAGMTRHNVQYALNNLWPEEIVKIPGKPNTYRRAEFGNGFRDGR